MHGMQNVYIEASFIRDLQVKLRQRMDEPAQSQRFVLLQFSVDVE